MRLSTNATSAINARNYSKSMHAILTIGSTHLLFTDATKATKALELLSKSLFVQQHYEGKLGGYRYTPEDQRGFRQIGLTMVSDDQVDLSSLTPRPTTKPVKRTGRLLLPEPQEQKPLFTPNPYAPEK